METFVYMASAGGKENGHVASDEYKEISGDSSRLLPPLTERDCPCSHRNIRARSILCLPVCVSLACCVVAVTVCIVIVLLTHSSLREWEERMTSRIEDKILSIVKEECDFDVTELQKVLSAKRETTVIRSRREGNPNKVSQKKPPPKVPNDKVVNAQKQSHFVHLNGRNSTSIYSHDNNFLWNNENKEILQNMGLVHDPRMEATVAVKIEKAGPYMVYSQVAVNGQSRLDTRFPYDCAHETVRTRGGQETVLLQSLTTQRNLGESIPSGHSTRGLKPIDTKLQMGVFNLKVGDKVSVRFREGCERFDFVMQPQHSYFGVIPMNFEVASDSGKRKRTKTGTSVPPKVKQ